MPVVITLLAVGALVWGLVCVRWLPPLALAAAAVVVGYVFGHAFWNADVGPLPLTLDRLLLAGTAAAFAIRWRTGGLASSPWAPVDWALALTLVWLTASFLMAGSSTLVVDEAPPLWRLLFSFWAPALLYLAARQSAITARGSGWLLGALSLLGLYLAITALAETAGAWSLVFPGYIADEELGMHFGRARGPALNSVSLGVYLAVCFWATWLLLPKLRRMARVVAFAALPLMAIAILLTYTRSTWLGLAASGVAVLAAQTPPRLRWKAVGGVVAAAAVLGVVSWQSVLRLEREDSGGVSQHSVQQRTAFAYVSWQMFKDHPVAGVGFGRFFDKKLPYLSDRTQAFELESLRPLHHHNTFLSLLTETGLIGVAAYLAVLGGVCAAGWRLSQSEPAAAPVRRLGVLAVATVMVYLPSAVFHDLSLVSTDQWLVFLVAGVAVGCERRVAASLSPPKPLGAASPRDPRSRPPAGGFAFPTG